MESMDRESRNIGGFMYGVAWTYLSIAASTISLEYISTLSFEEDLSDYGYRARAHDIYVYTHTHTHAFECLTDSTTRALPEKKHARIRG